MLKCQEIYCFLTILSPIYIMGYTVISLFFYFSSKIRDSAAYVWNKKIFMYGNKCIHASKCFHIILFKGWPKLFRYVRPDFVTCRCIFLQLFSTIYSRDVFPTCIAGLAFRLSTKGIVCLLWTATTVFQWLYNMFHCKSR